MFDGNFRPSLVHGVQYRPIDGHMTTNDFGLGVVCDGLYVGGWIVRVW
jgi:hypothetical protein